MSVEQVKLMEQIIYYGFKLTLSMQDIIAQIVDKNTLGVICKYLNDNHDEISQEELEIYLESKLKQ